MKDTPPDRVRLGAFEVDLRAGELRNGAGPIYLQDQPLVVLRMLVGRAGEVVTREEIKEQLWPDDTVVDFDRGINTTVRRLRQSLGDVAEEPKYVATVARRGYRLLVPVEPLDPAARTPSPAAADTSVAPAEQSSLSRPRTGRRWLILGGIVVAGIIAATTFSHARRPSKLTERDTIVLADFDNKTGDPVFDDTLKQALSIQLEQSPFLNVLSDDKISDTLKLMNRPAGERISREVSRELCLRSNSQAMLEGTIAAIGNRYMIGLKAVSCQTGDTLASSEAEAEDRNHVLSTLGKSASQLRQKLGESLGSVQKFDQPLEQVTTSSLEALQAYTKGTKAEMEGGGPAGVAHFKRAIELDPNFAIAYAALGNAYGATFESSETTRYITKAYELRDRVTLRERFNIESMYYQTIMGEVERAIDSYLEWLRYYPNDYFPHINLATDYNCLGQYDKGAVEARMAVQLQPGADNYRNLVTSYMGMNRLEEAKNIISEAEKNGIDGYPIRQWQYYLAFIQGDTAVMAQQDAWAKGKPLFEALQYTLDSSAEEDRGRFAEARELMQSAEERATRAGAKELVALMKVIHGPNEAEVGDRRIALSSVKAALPPKGAETSNVAPTAALTLALLGRETEARALADSIDKDSPHDTLAQTYTLPTLRAAIELGANRPLNAIKLLQAMGPNELGELPLPPNALYPAYLRGLAYLRTGQAKLAAAEFQKVIDHPGITLLHLQGALARLQLGRAQAIMGDKAAALKSYQDFLTLWKDADPDIPIYKQAKAEYAKLQ